MNLPKPDTIKSAVMIGGLFVAGVFAWKAYQGAQVVTKTVTEDLNPASNKNLIYSALPESGFVKSGGLDPVFRFLGL